VPHLFLHYGHRDFIDMDRVHDVRVPQAVYAECMELAPEFIRSVLALQSAFPEVAPEYLADPVLGYPRRAGIIRVEKQRIRASDFLAPLCNRAFSLEHVFQIIGQFSGDVAGALFTGLGVLCREEYARLVEVRVLEPDPDQFAHPAAELVDRSHHQLMLPPVYRLEVALPLAEREIAKYGLFAVTLARKFHIRHFDG